VASLTRLPHEELEARLVPYTTSGDLWPNPQLVTSVDLWQERASMSAKFQPGDFVRHPEMSLEMQVEGYVEAGKVVCSFVKGIARIKTCLPETELEKVSSPKPLPRRDQG
jgi:hypothetical protein